ncbi:MAG: P-loop NTPase fold protein [Acidobacteriaceae bacterium]
MAVNVPSGTESNSSPEQQPQEQLGGFVEQTVADHILGDQPAARDKEDRLGFQPYVTAVAKFLTHPSTKVPLTMSVEGMWGAGKSSFMRLLQERLASLGQKRFVTFEAWRYNADEGLWAAFLDAFDSQLRERMSAGERREARWRLVRLRMSLQGAMDTVTTVGWMVAALLVSLSVVVYAGRHGWVWISQSNKDVVQLIAAAGGLAGTVAALLVFLSKLAELLKSPAALGRAKKLWGAPNFHERMPLIYDMTANLKSLVEAYVGEETVYVFIDDLDRCEYSKAAELIQGLLLLASSAPKVALIVGLDRDKVAAALSAKQEKLLPYLYKVGPSEIYTVGNDYGQRFLEKFIQISYGVPRPRASGLKAMINPKVAPPEPPPAPGMVSIQAVRVATGEDDSTTLNAMIDMANEVFDHNPRNVKQFVNILRLQAFMASETGLFEDPAVLRMSGILLTVPQLAKFVALCMRWPDFVAAALWDEKLVGNVENAATSASSQGEGKTPDLASSWLSDPYLGALFRFQATDPQFLLANVDFRLLTTVAPGRVQQTVTSSGPAARPTSDPPSGTPSPTESVAAKGYPQSASSAAR